MHPAENKTKILNFLFLCSPPAAAAAAIQTKSIGSRQDFP